MTAGSSPGTSEISRPTVVAVNAAAVSRPTTDGPGGRAGKEAGTRFPGSAAATAASNIARNNARGSPTTVGNRGQVGPLPAWSHTSGGFGSTHATASVHRLTGATASGTRAPMTAHLRTACLGHRRIIAVHPGDPSGCLVGRRAVVQ